MHSTTSVLPASAETTGCSWRSTGEAPVELGEAQIRDEVEAAEGRVGALRSAAPVHRIELPGRDPFWAVVSHRHVMEVERNPDLPLVFSGHEFSGPEHMRRAPWRGAFQGRTDERFPHHCIGIQAAEWFVKKNDFRIMHQS